MMIKRMIPIFILFVFINSLCFLGKELEVSVGVNYNFILVVNTMLLFMSILNHYRINKMDKNNANAMVRSVMLGTLLKMGFFAIAALVYAKTQTTKVGIPTLLISMGLYLFYTWLEIKWATQPN
jgi:heme/copper-type cytochrome/quinol oxidase subunit 3